MSNAVSENNSDVGTDLGEEDLIEPAVEPDNNSRSIKEDVIVPEVVEKEEPAETNLVPISDIAQNTTTKKKSTLSKVGKSLATIIASI